MSVVPRKEEREQREAKEPHTARASRDSRAYLIERIELFHDGLHLRLQTLRESQLVHVTIDLTFANS